MLGNWFGFSTSLDGYGFAVMPITSRRVRPNDFLKKVFDNSIFEGLVFTCAIQQATQTNSRGFKYVDSRS